MCNLTGKVMRRRIYKGAGDEGSAGEAVAGGRLAGDLSLFLF